MKCIYEKNYYCEKLNDEPHCETCDHYISKCKDRYFDDIDYRCKKFKIRLGDEKCNFNICHVCGVNNPRTFDDLIEFFEEYTMKHLI